MFFSAGGTSNIAKPNRKVQRSRERSPPPSGQTARVQTSGARQRARDGQEVQQLLTNREPRSIVFFRFSFLSRYYYYYYYYYFLIFCLYIYVFSLPFLLCYCWH